MPAGARGQADLGRPEMYGATGRHYLQHMGPKVGQVAGRPMSPGEVRGRLGRAGDLGGGWGSCGRAGGRGSDRASGRSPLAIIMARVTRRFLGRCIRRRARRPLIRTHVLLWHQTLAVRRIARGQVEFYNACIELCRPEFLVVEDDELSSGGAPRWI